MKTKPTPAEQVASYLAQLDHPLKAELLAVRAILQNAHPALSERIKWNAPSYHVDGTDLVTFNPRPPDKIHLVFHHPAIVQIQSDLLEGDYKDRRMAYFHNMAEIEARRAELERIMRELVALAQ